MTAAAELEAGLKVLLARFVRKPYRVSEIGAIIRGMMSG